MLKLIRYLKPYVFAIILAVALLFLGVNADLALPDYMSKIVNIGLQQSGIESALPDAVRESQMNNIALFMTDEQTAMVEAAYTLAPMGDSRYTDKYPAIKNEALFILDKDKISDELTEVVGRAMTVAAAYASESAKQAVTADKSQMPAIPDGVQPTDMPAMPSNPYDMLRMMPPEQKAAVMDKINEQLAQYDESLIKQGGIAMAKLEYEALGVDTAKMQSNYIIKTGGLMLIITLVSVASSIVVAFISARIGAGVSMRLRGDVFKKVENFSSTEFDKFSTASLITRTTNDVVQVQMLVVMMIRMVFYAPIMGVGGVIRALEKSPQMSWIIAASVSLLIILIIIVYNVAVPKFKKMQTLIDNLNLVIRENLSGMMVIRAFNTQKHEEKRFDTANRNFAENNLFVNRVMVLMMPVMMLIMNTVMLTITWVGAHQIEQATMQVGDMMAFIQYAMQILMSFLMLSMMFIMLPRASVSATRIAEVLETKPSIKDPENAQKLPDNQGSRIEFKGVSFRYPGADEDVLTDINIVAKPGQTTAFIGSTGSGKSTLINLIPRFYDVTSGDILIDGVSVKNVTTHDLREKIGYIPQKGSLFSGTVRSNLMLGDDNAPQQVIDKSLEIAQATGFVSTMPDGVDSDISQGGTNVSGGQKQRLSIARALVKQAPIYIFDDSFSALDFKTDSLLRSALKEVTGKSTILIVAQRVSTIMNAEQICVLNEGKIVGIGTHSELLQSCETYREIASSQLSEEELKR